MDTRNSQAKDESTDSPTKTNGEVKSITTEENLGDFVVLDELNKDGDTQETKKEKAAEVDDKPSELVVKEANSLVKEIKPKEDEQVVLDSEKNGDSLVLTADDDLEPGLASPKKSNSETAPADVEESKKENTDAEVPTSENAETTSTTDTSKTSEEKAPAQKNQRVIWVSNISKTIKATDLKQHLSKAGKVTTAKIVTDGKRCFGYVLMENANDAAECIKTLNGTNFDGKNISLSFNKPTKVSNASKATEPSSDAKKSSKDSSRRKSETKRPDKRRRSSSKTGSDKNKSESDSKSAKTNDAEKLAEKRARDRSRSRERYIRDRNERERLKRRLVEEERKNHEARVRQIEMDERQRSREFKLEQERRKLEMERDLFEKQKREWARINEERRKLERARLEVEQQRVKLEEDLKKERMKRKSPEMIPSVVSKISDPKKNAKMMKRDDYKNSYDVPAPPPPKLNLDFDLGGRKPDERKMGRAGGRKIEVIDRKFYGDSSDRKKHYTRKPEYEESKPYMKRYPGEREDEHRTQWSPPTGPYGSGGVGSSIPRYQDTMSTAQFGGGPPSRAAGYYYHSSSSAPEFPRYDQVPNRKY